MIDYTIYKYVNVTGFSKSSKLERVQTGGANTAIVLPDDSILLLKINEASFLGKNGCSLLSVTQLKEHNVYINNKPKRYRGFLPPRMVC